jgi:hypothetical protein
MKIQPIRSYTPGFLPTQQEAIDQPSVLNTSSQHSARWLPQWAGSGLVVSLLLAQEPALAEEPKTPDVVLSPKSDAPQNATAESAKRFDVAPLLEEALQGDGRGSFGCVAVSPPSFLSEEEAIDIIRKHLLQAGLTLASDPVNIEGPIALTDPYGFVRRAKEEKPQNKGAASTVSEKKNSIDERAKKVSLDTPVRGTIQFDLATADGKVLVEYLSCDDVRNWEWQKFIKEEREFGGVMMASSTAASYDLSDLARRFSRFMADEPDDKQRAVGIFFDPLVRAKNLPKRPKYSVPSPPLGDGKSGGAWDRWWQEMQADPTYQAQVKEWEEARQKIVAEQAEGPLKMQVDHFIEHLRENGTLPR